MKSLELFSGAGGLALGFDRAGFEHLALFEFNEQACATVNFNKREGIQPFKDWNLVQGDVRHHSFKKWREEVDLIAGGPPCQPFSIGGKHKGHSDARDMFPEAARCIREAMPKAFVLENVKGLLRKSFTEYFSYILLSLTYPFEKRKKDESPLAHLSRLERIHTRGNYNGTYYRVVPRLLNAANYGVPQKRERIFIVGFRNDVEKEWSFPEHTHSEDSLLRDKWITGEYWEKHGIAKKHRPETPISVRARIEGLRTDDFFPCGSWKTVRDAIFDLPDPRHPTNGSSPQNHRFQPGARTYIGHTGSPMDEPAKTLKAGDHGVPGGENMLVDLNGDIRYFTIRESARLQTFPDSMIFPGSWTESMRQIGNAVPVKLAETVALSVKQTLQAG